MYNFCLYSVYDMKVVIRFAFIHFLHIIIKDIACQCTKGLRNEYLYHGNCDNKFHHATSLACLL